MIDVKLVVQGQRVIAVAPVIANAAVFIDNQIVDFQLCQPRRNGQPGLATTNHQNSRIAVFIFLRREAFVQPVWPAKIT